MTHTKKVKVWVWRQHLSTLWVNGEWVWSCENNSWGLLFRLLSVFAYSINKPFKFYFIFTFTVFFIYIYLFAYIFHVCTYCFLHICMCVCILYTDFDDFNVRNLNYKCLVYNFEKLYKNIANSRVINSNY